MSVEANWPFVAATYILLSIPLFTEILGHSDGCAADGCTACVHAGPRTGVRPASQ